jgi:hypothetical protein
MQDDVRANSMASFVSSETNPFVTTPSPVISNFDSAFAITQPTQTSPRQAITLSDPSIGNGSTFLQSIPEVQHQQQGLSIIIRERTNLNHPSLLSVSGQILISYHGDALPSTNVPIQLHHIDGIEQLTPNPQFIIEQDGQYLINTSQFTNHDQAVICFTYTLKTSTLALPVRISPSWKCVENVSYLIIKHNKNIVVDASKLRGVLQVVVTDQQVNNVQSTPQGIWDVTKQRLTWNINDLFAQYEQSNTEQRLLAKFYIEGTGTPQPVYLNYQIKDSLISGLSVSCDALDIKQLETIVQSDHIVYM